MKVQTGKGTISLLTLIAIWSISLVVNLPGLAVSPVLSRLDQIFPHTSQLEIQLLTVLPNLLIIPFVLLSGKLSVSQNKVKIVVVALIIYLGSGILYFFAKSMTALIVISCLLGVGCGLLIPLAAGLLADTFTGKYRMQQLGIKSGISNVSLVLATFVVGWLSSKNWHYPFLVYLLPVVPLVLTPFLRDRGVSVPEPVSGTEPSATTGAVSHAKVRDGFIMGRLYALMGMYFFVTFSAVIMSYYLPFLMQDYRMDSSLQGTITSIFYLAVFLPGFFLPLIIKVFRQATLPVATLSMAVGLIWMAVTRDIWSMGIAAFLLGYGYGVFQPVIYDKTTDAVVSGNKATQALSFVLAVNYLSITLTPFIMDFFRDLFHTRSNQFPFMMNFVLVVIFALIIVIFRRSFAFSIKTSYYK